MRNDDLIRLRHMLDASREAVSFKSGMASDVLRSDRKLSLALVRCVEMVGEAASRVTDNARAELPAIPWSEIIGMRNLLIHAYFDVDLDTLWNTVTGGYPFIDREA